MKKLIYFIFSFLLIGKMQAQTWEDLNSQGLEAFNATKYSEAEVFWLKATKQADKEFGKSHENYATSLGNLGALYFSQAKYIQAIPFYTDAISAYKKILPDTSGTYVDWVETLIVAYEKEGNVTKMQPLLVETTTIYKKKHKKNEMIYPISLNRLGIFCYNQKLYSKAKEFYNAALVVFRENGQEKTNDYATALNNLALVHYYEGEYLKTEALYMEILPIFKKNLGEKSESYLNALGGLGMLYFAQGNNTKALPLYLQTLAGLKELSGENSVDYATTLVNMGLLYQNQSRYAQAEAIFVQTSAIYKKLLGEKSFYYAISQNNLAMLYASQGNHLKALTLYTKAVNIYKQNFPQEIANCAKTLSNMAESAKALGEYKLAEQFLESALAMTKQVLGAKHVDNGIILNNLATLYQMQKKYTKALPIYTEMLSIYKENLGEKHPLYARGIANLAALYQNQKEYPKAEENYLKSLTIYQQNIGENNTEYALLLNNLGSFYEETKNNVKANTYYQQASSLLLAQIENNFGNLSENEKELFLNTFFYNFEVYNSFVIRANKQIPALTAWSYNNSLATKSLLFSGTQKMKERILNSNDSAIKNLYENWKNARTSYAKSLQMSAKELEKQGISTEKLQMEANELEKTLSQKSELFAKVNDKTRYMWKDVQKQLKANEAIVEIIRVEYYTTKKVDSTLYMALIITPTTQNQPEMVVLSNGKELETDAVAYYKNNIKFKKEDKASYNAFWAEIKAKLGNAKKVYFVPDGVYHQINLVTLQNPATKAYLRSETQVQLLSSSKDLIKYAENSKKQRKNFKDYQIHLFGYPAYAQKNDKISTTKEERSLSFSAKMDTTQRFFNPNSGAITILEGTKTEVNNISKILTDKKIKVTNYLENQAEEGTIKALKNPDILHIATHGFFLGDTEGFDKENSEKFRENPLLRSGLLLKDAEKGLRGEIKEGEDGVLTAQEALNLNLDETELVVMSACETGLGEIKNGEGVYGLQRSFQQAGAKTILMSLWKVDDIATQEVMTLFYSNLVAGKTKRQAFDDAQETLYQKYKNPYFWGAFVMVGE